MCGMKDANGRCTDDAIEDSRFCKKHTATMAKLGISTERGEIVDSIQSFEHLIKEAGENAATMFGPQIAMAYKLAERMENGELNASEISTLRHLLKDTTERGDRLYGTKQIDAAERIIEYIREEARKAAESGWGCCSVPLVDADGEVIGFTAPCWYTKHLEECPPARHDEPNWNDKVGCQIYHEMRLVSLMLGIDLMKHQHLILATISLIDVFELVLIIGRQQGKTVVIFVWLVHRILMHGDNAVFSQQDAGEAEKKVDKEVMRKLARHDLTDEGTGSIKTNRGKGPTFGVEVLTNEATLSVLSSGQHSGRGRENVGAVSLDEYNTDKDTRREGLSVPMQTVALGPKKITSGTAGDVNSVAFREKHDHACKALGNGTYQRLIEYSIPKNSGLDHSDPETWKKCLPGIGYSTPLENIQMAYDTMMEHDFAMEYLSIWLDGSTTELFKHQTWQRMQASGGNLVSGACVLAIHAHLGRDEAVAVVCDSSGLCQVVAVKEEPQLSLPWVLKILKEHPEISRIAVMKKGIMQNIGEELERLGHYVVWHDTTNYLLGCHEFHAAATQLPSKVSLVPSQWFDEANNTSFRREIETGGWVIRKQTEFSFISPIVAAVMAFLESVVMARGPQEDIYDEYEKVRQEIQRQKDSGEYVDEWEVAMRRAHELV